MKLLLNIYDYTVIMHVELNLGVISYRRLLRFDCLNLKQKFCPQP